MIEAPLPDSEKHIFPSTALILGLNLVGLVTILGLKPDSTVATFLKNTAPISGIATLGYLLSRHHLPQLDSEDIQKLLHTLFEPNKFEGDKHIDRNQPKV
jgi:hypothetical protein